MSNKQSDKGGKKPFTQNVGNFSNNSGNSNSLGGGITSNQPYSGFKGQGRGNLSSNFQQIQYEKKEYQKKEDGSANQSEDNSQSQKFGVSRGGFKDDNSTLRKKGLGKNKFQQIYNEYSHNRKNGIELNQDWLKELHTQFPQIFVREHLTPIFIDKSFCESFNIQEAFEKVYKKAPFDNSNPLNQFIKDTSLIGSKTQQANAGFDSDSEEDPQWEVEEDGFDFTFKTFDKAKYAQEMNQKLNKNLQTNSIVNIQQKQQITQPKNNPLETFLASNVHQGNELSKFIASIQTGGSNDVLGGLLQGGIDQNKNPNINNLELEYDLQYEDIDMKLERLAKENEKKKEFDLQYAGFEEEYKEQECEEEENDDEDNDLQAFGETSNKQKEARQINLQTVVQNEFDDANDEEDDENDEAFNTNTESPFESQKYNQDQIQQNQVIKSSFLSTFRQGEGNGTNEEQKTQENSFNSQNKNSQPFAISQPKQQKGISSLGGFGFGNKFENYLLGPDEDSFQGFNTYGQTLDIQKKESKSYLKEQMQQEIEEEDNYSDNYNKNLQGKEGQKNQLEELIINNDETEDIKQSMYNALFHQTTEQESREQEEKRKEKEKKKQERIAEIMAFQEEEKNNFFCAVAYILQSNPLESIWIYKDMKGNKQGPFNSLQMDSWKDHFQNTEVSNSRFIYWIKYKELTLYTKLYATRVKEMVQQQFDKNKNEQLQQMYMMQQVQQQAQSQISNSEINPQIQHQIYNLQMQFINQQQNPQDKISQQANIHKAYQMLPQNINQQQQQLMMTLLSQSPQLSEQNMNILNQQQIKNQLRPINQQQQPIQQQLIQQQQIQQQPIQQQQQQQTLQNIQQQLILLQQQQQNTNRNDIYNQSYQLQQTDQFYNQMQQYQQYLQLQQQQHWQQQQQQLQQGYQQQNEQLQNQQKYQQNKSVTNASLISNNNQNNNQNIYNQIDNTSINNNNQQNHRKNNSSNVNQNFKSSGNQNYQNQNNFSFSGNNSEYRQSDFNNNTTNRNFSQGGFQNNDFSNNGRNTPNNQSNNNNTNINIVNNNRNQQQVKNNDSFQKSNQNRGGTKPYINDQDFPSLS